MLNIKIERFIMKVFVLEDETKTISIQGLPNENMSSIGEVIFY